MNNIELQGNLTANPIVRKTKTGKTVTTFYLAVNKTFTNKAGERSKRTNYFKIVAWELLGQAAAYLTKGQNVIVQGSAEVQNWQGADNAWHSVNEVTAGSIGVSIINLFREVIASDMSKVQPTEPAENNEPQQNTNDNPWTRFEKEETEMKQENLPLNK